MVGGNFVVESIAAIVIIVELALGVALALPCAVLLAVEHSCCGNQYCRWTCGRLANR